MFSPCSLIYTPWLLHRDFNFCKVNIVSDLLCMNNHYIHLAALRSDKTDVIIRLSHCALTTLFSPFFYVYVCTIFILNK